MNIAKRRDPLMQFLCDPNRGKEVLALINSVQVEEYRIILMLRYCEHLPWVSGKYNKPCVFERMREHELYYSERQMFRMHKQALEEVRHIFENIQNEKGEQV